MPVCPDPGPAVHAAAPSLGAVFDRAVDLANDLAQLAQAERSASLARAATDALTLASELHQVAETLATLAGAPEPTS